MTELLAELKRHIVDDLEIEDVNPDEVGDDEPLFGDGDAGALNLDSIDGVELVVMLERRYGIRLTEMEKAKEAFASVRTLAKFVEEHRD